MTQTELWRKFADCAARTLPQGQIAPVFDRLAAIDSLQSVAELTRLLQPARDA